MIRNRITLVARRKRLQQCQAPIETLSWATEMRMASIELAVALRILKQRVVVLIPHQSLVADRVPVIAATSILSLEGC